MHYIFDANLSHRLAEGLHILEQGNDKTREPLVFIEHADKVEALGRGATDAEIIAYAGKTQAIIISQDDDFKRIKSNMQLLKGLNAGYVLYKAPKKSGARYWEIVEAFIKGWKQLKTKITETNFPFVLQVDRKGGISKIEL